ncbi:hypothetical protein LIER_41343 [Lithospermum erythrorhizon]|uniref:Uncharacterized protein n=1 Tax=Lithospermum erythrorhizon TaxID=34254 RepID=A0AAV3RDP6_LITER
MFVMWTCESFDGNISVNEQSDHAHPLVVITSMSWAPFMAPGALVAICLLDPIFLTRIACGACNQWDARVCTNLAPRHVALLVPGWQHTSCADGKNS